MTVSRVNPLFTVSLVPVGLADALDGDAPLVDGRKHGPESVEPAAEVVDHGGPLPFCKVRRRIIGDIPDGHGREVISPELILSGSAGSGDAVGGTHYAISKVSRRAS